jgi:predicted DNA-binding WGR domain protein
MIMQSNLFPTEVRMRRIEPEKNMYRFYAMSIQPTLFNEWAVVRNWGRIGTAGRSRLDIHNGPGEAIDAIGEIKSAKIKRGYLVYLA